MVLEEPGRSAPARSHQGSRVKRCARSTERVSVISYWLFVNRFRPLIRLGQAAFAKASGLCPNYDVTSRRAMGYGVENGFDQQKVGSRNYKVENSCSYACISRFLPVISFGCGNPSRKSKVGATSARMPSLHRNFLASRAT